MKEFSLEGRKALVTGGSRGIGGEVVELFARYGAEVAFCHYGDAANAEALAARLTAAGSKVYGTECDVSDEAAVDAMAAWAKDKLGQVDILVNMAGIGGDKAFVDLTVADWDRMLGVHLRGHFLVTRHFFGDMVVRGYGRIVNCASQLAYRGAPGLAHYCAAKAGIVGFTRALAYEGAPHGVTVNAIAPGATETVLLNGLTDEWRAMKLKEIPLGRFGEVSDIAPTILLLASDAGAFYVGQTLSPNGGDIML
jgi:3-oxoacyl-[acyl-carrier protein] reductase